MNIPHFHILTCKHVPETNTSTSGVRIRSERFEQSIKVPYTNAPGSHSSVVDTAVSYLASKGIEVMGKGESTNHYYLITDSRDELGAFLPLKPIK